MAKKPAKKPAKPAKKAVAKPAAKKAAKPVKKVAAKKPAPKKPAPKKVVAKKPAPKPVAKKPVAKPVAKKPEPAPKKEIVKPAPLPKAADRLAPKSALSPKPQPKKKDGAEAAAPPIVKMGTPVMPKAQPIVKKKVSTLEAGDKARYSDDELEEFRQIINKKLDEARRDYDLLKQTLANTDNNGTEDTSPSFKMIEDGSETLSREETAQLASRQEKFIKHLEDALLRIRNKTYGICRVTGKLISKERLRLVPHATLSIEAKQQMNS
jgi:RNA polymerase-binding transcription factor DksA